MVGNSAAMREVFVQVRRFATFDAPVLIDGESGTGKELVARAIHERSYRACEPFIAVNCAVGPATLTGTELFGCEMVSVGASRPGQIQQANGGTVYFEQIDSMPLKLQRQLLRLLDEGEIVRVGGLEPLKVDVRVIASTNVHPREAVAAGRLLEDLYYRLNVLGMSLPPLRERSDDIEVLATFYLRQTTHDLGREVGGFAPEAVAAMQAYPWPGNVPELIATIRRAAVLSNDPRIQAGDLRLQQPPGSAHEVVRLSRPSPGSEAERRLLLNTLRQCGFNITRTAHALTVSRVTLYRMLQRNHLALRQECVVQDAAGVARAGI